MTYRFRYATRYRWRYVDAAGEDEDAARAIAGLKAGVNPSFLTLTKTIGG